MQENSKPPGRVARLRHFFGSTHVQYTVIFNVLFVCGGYVMWGTAEIGTIEWYLDECAHLAWPGFHMWILLSYCARHHPIEFQFSRFREEALSWLLIIFLSVFAWEGIELLYDTSGVFSSVAQVGNVDTMIDIFLSGMVAPFFIIRYRRWKDGLNLFFTSPNKKQAIERKLSYIGILAAQVAEETSKGEPDIMHSLRDMIHETWQGDPRVSSVLKMLHGVARGSRRERRRRRAYMRSLQQKP
ncbi:MAG: hypothetical protein A3J54_00465 [Candidatus Ryanbacteria bacterium RIFCSPHIGHO2_02_FULL_45_13b]|uniref:Uncharacterized protein n=1 Tax=Candidatus Ryanbacteria bacterium RIFCSPHIGHO2_02_FULL_45_13b TaxID=1802117 RepID=A0A1G2G3Q2_9BACT|nr:MAG: hypothetical protein A3J54_00465 [Candidatus Ryanbacteria bacterium RIFCSPHIGHO2_02_FULL_45_13b]